MLLWVAGAIHGLESATANLGGMERCALAPARSTRMERAAITPAIVRMMHSVHLSMGLASVQQVCNWQTYMLKLCKKK